MSRNHRKLNTAFVSLDEQNEAEETYRQKLIAEKKRTGLGSVELFKRTKSLAKRISFHQVDAWFDIKRAKSARRSDLIAVIAAYEKETDNQRTVDLHKKDELTDISILERLFAERERTGLSGKNLYERISDPIPKGLTSSLIFSWLAGAIREAEPDHVKAVLDTYAEQKDRPKIAYVALHKKDKTGITPFEKIYTEKARTKLAAMAVLNALTVPLPEGLNTSVVTGWFSGKTYRARRNEFELILKVYAQQPDGSTSPYISLDAKIGSEKSLRKKLRDEKSRTGLSAWGILREIQDAPDGLTGSTIRAWLDATAKSAREDQVEAVLEAYANQPKAPKLLQLYTKNKKSSKTPYDLLMAEVARTGLGSAALLLNVPELSVPQTTIDTWIYGRSGITRFDQFQMVMEAYAAQESSKRIDLNKKEQKGKSIREILLEEQKRTGLTPRDIFPLIKALPAGLTEGVVCSWFYSDVATAENEYVQAVFKAYENAPAGSELALHEKDDQGASPYDRLQNEARRTGISVRTIVRKISVRPDGLTDAVVKSWFKPWRLTVKKTHLEAVLHTYAQEPTSSVLYDETKKPARPLNSKKSWRVSKNET